MAPTTAIVVLFMWWCMSLSSVAVGGMKLSEEEDLELERQLKVLNKPAVKIIRTIDGDAYGCVDFYKQPAFDHPLLRNHTFHPETRSIPYNQEGRFQDVSPVHKPNSMWLNGKGCPVGTVPIRRINKDDLIRSKLASEIHASNIHPQTHEFPGSHFAVLRTRRDHSKKFTGGGMYTAVYNPQVQGNQTSSSRMKMMGPSDVIEVGWTVNPTLYKDNKTRMYIFTNAGGSQNRCFNLHCPGFVLANPDMPVDPILSPISKQGGPIYGIQMSIKKDQRYGKWYLIVGPKRTVIGWWPQEIFLESPIFAHFIDWGGHVYSPPDEDSPPMGSGAGTISEDMRQAAFVANLLVADETYNLHKPSDTELYTDIGQVYDAKDIGNKEEPYFYTVLYGGPGGYSGE